MIETNTKSIWVRIIFSFVLWFIISTVLALANLLGSDTSSDFPGTFFALAGIFYLISLIIGTCIDVTVSPKPETDIKTAPWYISWTIVSSVIWGIATILLWTVPFVFGVELPQLIDWYYFNFSQTLQRQLNYRCRHPQSFRNRK